MLCIKERYLALLLVILISPLAASVDEYSAMANAVMGLTLLSDSVADYSISPVMTITGLSANYHRPFNISKVTVLGLHNAISRSNIHLAVGTNYMHHQDYSKHDPYLNINYHFHGFSLGATGHMSYDAIQLEDGEYSFSYDLGAAYNRGDYGAEVKLLRADSDAEQVSYSMKAALSPDVTTAAGYVMEKNYEDYFRVGIIADLHNYVSLYGSWQNEPNRFGLGVKIKPDRWGLMYSIRTHSSLDPSHAISLDINW